MSLAVKSPETNKRLEELCPGESAIHGDIVVMRNHRQLRWVVADHVSGETLTHSDESGNVFYLRGNANLGIDFLKSVAMPVGDYKGIATVKWEGKWMIPGIESTLNGMKPGIDMTEAKVDAYIALVSKLDTEQTELACGECESFKAKHLVEHFERGEFNSTMFACMFAGIPDPDPPIETLRKRFRYIAHRYYTGLFSQLAMPAREYFDMLESCKWS